MHLDWTNEERDAANVWMASYQQRAMAQFNKKAQPQLFYPGDLVFRRVFENTIETGTDKLQPNWEDPYVVSKIWELGAYHLQTMDNMPLLHPWNLANLKKYYQ